MTTKTSVDLSKRVLQKLRVVDAVTAPNAEDHELVSGVLAAKLQELAYDGVGGFAVDAIPLVYFEPLADFIAASVAGDYGITLPPGAYDATYGRLAGLLAQPPSGESIDALYY